LIGWSKLTVGYEIGQNFLIKTQEVFTMKRVLPLLLVLVLSFSLLAVGIDAPVKDEIWSEIPANEKFVLRTEDFSGEWDLLFGGALVSERNLKLFNFSEENREIIQGILEQNYPGQEVFLLYVYTYQTTYFWPNEFSFVQDNSQYNVENSDFIKISETFSGELKKDTYVMGYMAAPKGVNLEYQTEIWYGDYAVNF